MVICFMLLLLTVNSFKSLFILYLLYSLMREPLLCPAAVVSSPVSFQYQHWFIYFTACVYVCVPMLECMYTCHRHVGAPRGQKSVVVTRTGVTVVVSQNVGLGSDLRVSARAARALHYRAISPPSIQCYYQSLSNKHISICLI